MTMQHKGIFGTPIATGSGERFEERMRRIGMSYRVDAKKKASIDSPWLTLRVDTGREKAVKNVLDDEQIEALVPMRKGPELRRRGRLIPPSLTPVMVGYVLVRCALSDKAMLGLKSFDHVRDILGGCSSPRLIRDQEVKLFNKNADEGSFDWERVNPVIFGKGDKARVVGGPFDGLRCEVVTARKDGKGDAVVLVELFRNQIPVNLPLANLEKL